MKKILILALLALAVSINAIGGESNVPKVETTAETNYGGGWVISTGNGVRVRFAPSLNAGYYNVRMNKGQSTEWYEYRNGWYRVRIGVSDGWVSAQFMRRASQAEAARRVVLTGDRVILRLSPGGKDSGLRCYFGDTYRYCGQSGAWYRLKRGNRYYWVSTAYAILVGDM